MTGKDAAAPTESFRVQESVEPATAGVQDQPCAEIANSPHPAGTDSVAVTSPVCPRAPLLWTVSISEPRVPARSEEGALEIDGTKSTLPYVYSAFPEFVPAGVVTNTLAVPAVPAGVVAVIVVAFTTVTPVAAVPPMVTAVAPVKSVPVIVTAVPPATLPDEGLILETVGATAVAGGGQAVNENGGP